MEFISFSDPHSFRVETGKHPKPFLHSEKHIVKWLRQVRRSSPPGSVSKREWWLLCHLYPKSPGSALKFIKGRKLPCYKSLPFLRHNEDEILAYLFVVEVGTTLCSANMPIPFGRSHRPHNSPGLFPAPSANSFLVVSDGYRVSSISFLVG